MENKPAYASTVLNKSKPFQVFYVSALPGQNGKDWGYTTKKDGEEVYQPDKQAYAMLDKALLLSPYWQRRFRCDSERCGRTAQFHAN